MCRPSKNMTIPLLRLFKNRGEKCGIRRLARRRRPWPAVVAATWLAVGTLSPAATYYAAPDGSDANPGTLARPFATISHAIQKLSPGDTLCLRGGAYYQQAWAPNSGTPYSPITIAGYAGENPILDGAYTNPAASGSALFLVQGSNVVVSGITIQRSYGMGLALEGPGDQALSVTSQSNLENGILVLGSADHSLVRGCAVYFNCCNNQNFTNTSWSSGLSAARGGFNSTLADNRVWNNWGEGLSTYECSNTIITGNTVFDNQCNVYLSDARGVRLEGNLIYATPGNLWSNGGSQVGIMLGDEKYTPPSSDNTVVNNLVMGCHNSLYYWQGVKGGGLINVIIANNTFVDAAGDANLKLGIGVHARSAVQNNIVSQAGSIPIALAALTNGISFSHNLWSESPPLNLRGEGDVVGGPRLRAAGPIGPGQLEADYFQPLAGSPAKSAAQALPAVPVDFFGFSRGRRPSIGAIENGRSHALPEPSHGLDKP